MIGRSLAPVRGTQPDMLDQCAPVLATLSAVRPRVTIIYNPTSGCRNGRRLRRFVEAAVARGLFVDVRTTGRAGDAEAMAAAAAAEEATDVLVVAGGDGTINEVINGLAGAASPPTLAILPLGTANVLAIEIGADDTAPRLVEDIVRGATTGGPNVRMCVAEANGRRFAMMAGAGFDAHVVAAVDPRLKRLAGKAAYVVAFAQTLLRFGRRRYRVTVDGTAHEVASVVIANGHYYGGRFTCTPEARLATPELHVCLFLRGGRWRALRYGIALLGGVLHRRVDVRIVRGRHVRVEAASCEPVQCDGDVATALPLEVRATGETLRLIASAGAGG